MEVYPPISKNLYNYLKIETNLLNFLVLLAKNAERVAELLFCKERRYGQGDSS